MNRRAVLLTLVVLAAASLPLFLGWMAWRAATRVPAALVEKAVAKEETTLDHGAVVTRIQQLARLETAAMRVMHVSTIRQSYGVVPQTLAGDELTFVGVGDVIAGVDLGKLRPEDVTVEGRSVILRLPPSEILLTRLDNQKSHVANRSTGMLRRRDPGLETRIRQTAENGIREEALKRNILELAERNAEERLAALLRSLEFESVRIVTARPRPGDQR